MQSIYIRKKKHRATVRIFRGVAAVAGLVALLVLGNKAAYDRGHFAGRLDGAQELTECTESGGTGYMITRAGFLCLYD